MDLCLVHNGSLSNHSRLRTRLQRNGIEIRTKNDSEVAAGYLMWRMQQGDTLQAALRTALDELDGFYTFAIGTADGFAVLRDPIACKPAVLAETDAYVAMASEFQSAVELTGELTPPRSGSLSQRRCTLGVGLADLLTGCASTLIRTL